MTKNELIEALELYDGEAEVKIVLSNKYLALEIEDVMLDVYYEENGNAPICLYTQY